MGMRASHQGTPVQYEDELHQTGDSGVMMLGVRNDTETSICDADGDYVPASFDDQGRMLVNIRADAWTVTLVSDEGLNDSDKTIAVIANQLWHILWVWVELTTTATVGDRQIVVELQDGANDVIAQFRAGAVQAESLTCYYCFAPSMADLTAFRDTDYLMTPFPPTVLLPATFQVRVYDNKAIAAAADDLVIQMQYAWRAA